MKSGPWLSTLIQSFRGKLNYMVKLEFIFPRFFDVCLSLLTLIHSEIV